MQIDLTLPTPATLAGLDASSAGSLADYLVDGYTAADWAHDMGAHCVDCGAVWTDADWDGDRRDRGWVCEACLDP